jgi:hypothetical protein
MKKIKLTIHLEVIDQDAEPCENGECHGHSGDEMDVIGTIGQVPDSDVPEAVTYALMQSGSTILNTLRLAELNEQTPKMPDGSHEAVRLTPDELEQLEKLLSHLTGQQDRDPDPQDTE